MRLAATVILLAFVVTLAVMIGTRLSTDALAVVVGVACGVIAGVPMSVLILAVLNRRANTGLARGTSPTLPQSTAYPPSSSSRAASRWPIASLRPITLRLSKPLRGGFASSGKKSSKP